MSRIILVGGPRTGKSTLARELRQDAFPPDRPTIYCGDPRSLCKEPQSGVTYLPEGLSWSEGSQFVADEWFSLPGPWVMEGQIMARALRKWMSPMNSKEVAATRKGMPCDRIIVLTEPKCEMTHGQASMCKAVMTVWNEIKWRFEAITEYR